MPEKVVWESSSLTVAKFVLWVISSWRTWASAVVMTAQLNHFDGYNTCAEASEVIIIIQLFIGHRGFLFPVSFRRTRSGAKQAEQSFCTRKGWKLWKQSDEINENQIEDHNKDCFSNSILLVCKRKWYKKWPFAIQTNVESKVKAPLRNFGFVWTKQFISDFCPVQGLRSVFNWKKLTYKKRKKH